MSKQKKEKQTNIPINEDSAERSETGLAESEAETESSGKDAPVNDNSSELKDIIRILEEDKGRLEEEKERLNDRYLRTSAEFDNYKKRLDRQWEEFKRYAHESLVKELLPVVDNLERALAAACGENDQQTEGLLQGVEMTLQEILKIFERFHVVPIQALGEPFDPNFHQAVARQETEEVEENRVLEEYQKGYMIHDRLLRPSMVVVATRKTADAEKKNE